MRVLGRLGHLPGFSYGTAGAWIGIFLIGITGLPGWACAGNSPSAPLEIKPVTGAIILRNNWIHAVIDPSKAGRIQQLYAQTEPLLWPTPEMEVPPDSWPGASLVLYASHPLSSTAAIPCVSLETIASSAESDPNLQVTIHSTYEGQLSVIRKFAIGRLESILSVSTTITNAGGSPAGFYPAEVVSINTEFAQSGMPNMNLYFYSPYTATGGAKPYEITLGLVDNPQFAVLPEHSLFLAKNAHRIGAVKLTNEKYWFAFQNLIHHAAIQGGTVCAVEFSFPGRHPDPVSDNLLLHIQGAGEYIQNGKLRFNQTDVAKSMRATYTLGRVELPPGASFTYTACWSLTSCGGPVVDVRNGVVFNQHLEVFLPPNRPGFLNYANLGIPQEGGIGFQYFDADNEIYKITRPDGQVVEHLLAIPLIMELAQEKSRPSQVIPFLPTPIHHFTLVFFSEEQMNAGDEALQQIQDSIRKIRMVLIDENQKPIRFLDEVNGPFPVHKEPLQF